jgi:PadR family transcriptional regulator, regulatory protein PadR
MRRTEALVKVAIVMMSDPHGQYWGYDLTRQARVLSGSLYPILRQMLDDGLLTDDWEDPATVSDRPPRRYYELTDKGRAVLGATLAAGRCERRFCELNWGFAG